MGGLAVGLVAFACEDDYLLEGSSSCGVSVFIKRIGSDNAKFSRYHIIFNGPKILKLTR